MKRRRTVVMVVCAALAVAVAASAVAAAAYKTGRYEGTTSQGETISLRAKKLGVKKFAFDVITDCDDGTRFGVSNSGGQAPTNTRGRFEALFTGSIGTTVLKGRLKRKKASGTFESEATSPTGALCTASGDWRAEKQ
jgi:opacity protein-like surface antigen